MQDDDWLAFPDFAVKERCRAVQHIPFAWARSLGGIGVHGAPSGRRRQRRDPSTSRHGRVLEMVREKAHTPPVPPNDDVSVYPPHQSDPDFLVLHTLRCIGVASEDRVATASHLPRQDTGARLRLLSGRGLVTLDPGPFGGWGLTDDGRTTEQELVRIELDLTGASAHVRSGYESFMELNPKLLEACSDWQMRKARPIPSTQ